METKVCRICEVEKKLEQFRKSGKYYRSECKECEKKYKKEYMKEYYLKNKENEHYKKIREEYRKTYIRPKESIEKHKQTNKIWKKEHKEHVIEYARKYNNEHIKENRKTQEKWRKENKEKIRFYQQKDYIKRTSDPILKLKMNIRNRINDSFKKQKYKKSKANKEILGCSVDEFVSYLLQTFKNNYGYDWDKIEKVNIDHIIPLSTAKSEEDVIKLCHYTNLQLLKAKDNLYKSNKMNWKLNENSEL